MLITFYASDKARERVLAHALSDGAKAHGDEVEIVLTGDYQGCRPETDVAAFIGVKSKKICEDHWREGAHTLYIDKGYTRHKTSGLVRGWEYWKCVVDDFQPLRYFECGRPHDRLERLGIDLKPRRKGGAKIIFAQSTQKYYDWHDLGDCEEYARKVMRRFFKMGYPKHDIVYRPKPTRKDMGRIKGYSFSPHAESIQEALQSAKCLVTFGSNAAVDAIVNGVPAIVLGDGIAKPVSNTRVEQVGKLKFPSDGKRLQWLADLSYCQWTSNEIRSGEAWSYLREVILS